MQIVFVSGIRTPLEMPWVEMRTAFARAYPGAKFCVATESNCNFWEIGRFRRFIRATAIRFDTGEDVLLVGHSMGGVMACAMQPLMRKSYVMGIVTIHSPHTFLDGLFTSLLGAEDVHAPILSFQALHDGLVWWGSRHPQSIKHVRNHANHFHDLWEHPENAELVAQTSAAVFVQQRRVAA